MNTVQIECFIEVASTLSFAQAASRLSMTQPAVSKQVKSLEGELGVKLLERTTRSVSLTSAGESFMPDAAEMLALMRDAADRAGRQRAELANTIRLGYTDTVELVMLSKAWRRMRAERSGVHPVLRCGLQDDSVNAVAHGKLDAALGMQGLFPDVDGVAFEKLGDATLRCVLPARNRLVSREKVSLDELADMPQAICAPADLRRRSVHDDGRHTAPGHAGQEVFMCSSVAEACSLVSAGLAYALVPSPFLMPSKGIRDIELVESETVAYGVFARERGRASIVDRFIETLRGQMA